MMNLSRVVAAAGVVLVGVCARGAEVTITRDGRSDYVISVRAGASAVERTAAGELQKYLKKATGADLAVREAALGDEVIEVRSDPQLATDGIRIDVRGNKIVLAGGGARGAIYAVDSFLEDEVGVRWWTSSEESVPTKPTLVVDLAGSSYAPSIGYRECFNADPNRHGEFAARLKLNGSNTPVPAEWGGHYSIIGWCHTSFSLVPPGVWFGTHPEWYAMDARGKRGTAQVCWSDEGMRHEMARAVLARIKENPSAGMISVSQEDGPGQCQCDKCRAIATEDGSESGPLLRGVNAVAAEVAKASPEFLVQTLAYQWSRKPPKVTRPAKNVLIMLCSIEADCSHPLDGQEFGRDLRAWSQIADHLFVWNYVTNFADYLIPQPNWNAIGPDLRFFAGNHVVGVFEQGDAYNVPAGDLLPMRVWVQAHLLWDPSRDQHALTKEFLDGYYGPAGMYLLQYVTLVNAVSGDEKFRWGCYHAKPTYLTPAAVAAAETLFDHAAAAVSGDAVLSKRVAVQRLIIDHVKLMTWNFSRELKAKPVEAVRRDYEQAADAFIREASANGANLFSEMLGFAGYGPTLRAAAMNGLPVELPRAGAAPKPGEYDVQEDQFTLYRKGDLTEVVDDPSASNGKAARMRGGNTEWGIQLHVNGRSPYAGKGPWNCWVVARVDREGGGSGGGHAFTTGLYSNASGIQARRDVGLDEAGGGYRAYGFVLDELKDGEYFWVEPGGGKSILVDRIFIERTGSKDDPTKSR
jgi:hypothetical protein